MWLVSAGTIRRRLHHAHFRTMRAYPHHQLRGWHQAWLRLRLNYKYSPAVFRWISVHTLLHSDGRAPVYHRPLERFVDYCLQRYDRVDGGSLIIWVAVTSFLWTKWFFVDDTLNAPIYINTVLTTTLSCLFTIQNEHRFMLQQGNAMVFVQQQNIDVMSRPLSISETNWDAVSDVDNINQPIS